MTAYTDFHYSPTGSGVISGSQVLEQTEQGINGLGQYVQDNISGAIDTANEALTIAQTANTNATTALNTANSFSDAITTANQTANNALTTAQSAQSTANAASTLATTANNNATSALNAANAATSNVNTLTSTVNGLGNRMTAAENAISANAGNITTLQNNLATTNANVTAAANAASSAQATATSAQSTATLARNQAYVLRYTGTTITGGGTIAYADIDNTDNIKAGDKIIDVTGDIYRIASVDIANETVTVDASDVIHLANDSDVVHKSGNETIAGDKTFSNAPIIDKSNSDTLKLKNTILELGELPASDRYLQVGFKDKNDDNFAYFRQMYSTAGVNELQIFVRNKFASGAPSTSGNIAYSYFGLGLNADGTQYAKLRGTLTPYSDSTYDLGSSSYQWNNLYAKNYYYNGTVWGLDQANTWTNTNTFTAYVESIGSAAGDEYSSNARTNLWLMGNRDTEKVSGILFDTYRQNTAQGTGMHILGIGIKENSVRYEGCRWGWYWDNNLNGYTFDFKPTTQGANQALKHNLGTITDKWDTINGINPGALSLPDWSSGEYDNVATSITNLDGSRNTYVAPFDGWLAIAIPTDASSDSYIAILTHPTSGVGTRVQGKSLSNSSTVHAYMPFKKGQTAYIYVLASSVNRARFYPCLGNV